MSFAQAVLAIVSRIMLSASGAVMKGEWLASSLRLAVRGNESVEVDELRKSLGGPVGDTGRYHATVTVTDKGHVA
jgi:hypothetical protein